LENSVLSPFLYKGLTSENFNLSGNIPVASHKSNPSSTSQGIEDSYSTLLWVMWKAVWRAYPVEGCYDTGWLMGLWSTQAKVEGIVLKAA
jgi:hypothetical protein